MNFFDPTKFAQYSMLTDYLYDSKGDIHLNAFLRRISRLLIVCDPPFGAMISPLMNSLNRLELRYHKCHDVDRYVLIFYFLEIIYFYRISSCDYIVALPYFLEKHVVAGNERMKLTDYVVCYCIYFEWLMFESFQVCYNNHKDFISTKSRRNPIRFYTTLPSERFVLPSSARYRYVFNDYIISE